MHVRMNLFPFDVTGEMGPTKSIQISCIGMSGVLKCPNSAELLSWFCSTHSVQFLQCLNVSFLIPGQKYSFLRPMYVLLPPLCPPLLCARTNKGSLSIFGTNVHLNVSLSSNHSLYSTPLSKMNIFSAVLSSFSLFNIPLATSSCFCSSFTCLLLSGNVILLVVFSLTVTSRCAMCSTTGVEATGGISPVSPSCSEPRSSKASFVLPHGISPVSSICSKQ